MGQKTHPNGLRVGIYRKWTNSWYGSTNERKHFESAQQNQFFISPGNIASRGGVYTSGIESFVENLFKRYACTKFSKTVSILFVDFRFFKGVGGHVYGFLFYTKQLLSRK
jgi:hypothetical protein